MMFKETGRGPNNGFNNTGLRFGDHGTKEILLGVVDSKSLTGFKLCPTTPNSTQQHTTGSVNEPSARSFLKAVTTFPASFWGCDKGI